MKHTLLVLAAGLLLACAPKITDLTPSKFPIVFTEYSTTVSQYSDGPYWPYLSQLTSANRFIAHIERANSVTITVNGVSTSMQRVASNSNLYIYDAPDQCVSNFAYSIVARNNSGTTQKPPTNAPKSIPVSEYGRVYCFANGFAPTPFNVATTFQFSERLTTVDATLRHLANGKNLTITNVTVTGTAFAGVTLPSTPLSANCGTSIPLKISYSPSNTAVGTVDTGTLSFTGTLDNSTWALTVNLHGQVVGSGP